MRTRRPIPVYTLETHARDIRRIFDYAFREYPPEIMVPRFDLREMPDVLDIGGMTVKSFIVDHGATPVIGLRVNSFAYITDVSRIPPAAEAVLKDLDYLILDAVRYKPHPNHFDMAKAIAVARHIGARRTYFTHLSDDYDHDKVER